MARRGHGEGTIYQRKSDGRWVAMMSLPSGKRKAFYGDTRQEVAKRLAQALHEIEPWWKILRSLARKGRRFETWEQICAAVEAATVYWNAHKHPFIWGRRRRHRPRRLRGIAAVPVVA